MTPQLQPLIAALKEWAAATRNNEPVRRFIENGYYPRCTKLQVLTFLRYKLLGAPTGAVRIPEWSPTRWSFAFRTVSAFLAQESAVTRALREHDIKGDSDKNLPHLDALRALLKKTYVATFRLLSECLKEVANALRILEGIIPE